MRFADLLGDPDDDGNAPGTSTTEGPGVPASAPGAAPVGASGSVGGPPSDAADPAAADDDLARWFTADETEPTEVTEVAAAPPADAPPRAQALATATGALDEPASEDSASEPAPAAPAPSGTARDDLLPARPSGHGRKRR